MIRRRCLCSIRSSSIGGLPWWSLLALLFVVGASPGMAQEAPDPLSPDSLVVRGAATLLWLPVDGASSYHVQVARTSAFATLVDEATGLTARRYEVTVPEDGDYSWRVRAVTPAGRSPWSEVMTWTADVDEAATEVEAPPPVAEEDKEAPSRRNESLTTSPVSMLDRTTAVTRSALFPGLGQFYKQQSTKGIAFIVAEAVALGAAGYFIAQNRSSASDAEDAQAAYLAELRATTDPDVRDFQANSAAYAEWQTAYDDAESARSAALIAGVAAAGIWIANVVDSALGFSSSGSVAYTSSLNKSPVRPYLSARQGTLQYGAMLRLTF